MKIKDPRNLTTDEIVQSLLTNTKSQFTESAHAEIYRRLIDTIQSFNEKASRTEKVMLILATSQVILAMAQIILSLK